MRFVRDSSGRTLLAVEAELGDDRLWLALDPGEGVTVDGLLAEIGNLGAPHRVAMLAGPSAEAPLASLGVSGPDRAVLRLPEGTGASTHILELVLGEGEEPLLRLEADLDAGWTSYRPTAELDRLP